MDPPAHPFLLKIHKLDQRSSDFQQRLDDILHTPEYKRHVGGLKGGDLEWFVEYLDKVLDKLDDRLDIVSRECGYELGRVCGDKEIFPRSFEIIGSAPNVEEYPFASGSFSDVYKGTFRGTAVCVKRLKLYEGTDSETKKEFRREAVMWKYLKHPNVLPLLGATINPPELVSVLMPGGNLTEYLMRNPRLGAPDRLRLLLNITKGLDYLHSREVIHGGLKPENILVDIAEDTNTPRACIAGFRTAVVTQNLDRKPHATRQGSKTTRWSAPEVLREQKKPTQKSDVFSFAMITIAVLTGRVPFSDISEWVVPGKILEGHRPPRPEHPSYTDDLWVMIQRCWNQDPNLRPEISKVSTLLSSLTSTNKGASNLK